MGAMGVQVLSPESHHNKQLRSLPKIPNTSHYSMKPYNTVKPTRALPTVPNSNVSKMENSMKASRALPRAPKLVDNKKFVNKIARHGRLLPEVPFRDNTGTFKDTNTSGSSRASSPRQILNTSINTQHSNNQHNVSNHSNQHYTGNNNNQHNHGKEHQAGNHGNQRQLPRLPKLLQKPKPEQNRIEFMHATYKKEGDVHSDKGNYEQALKSYNLVCILFSMPRQQLVCPNTI